MVAESLGIAYLAIALTATLAGLALLHLGALHGVVRWDHDVSVWFVDHRTPALNRTSDVFTWVANTSGIVGVAAVVTAFLLWRRWGHRALVPFVALALELACFLSANYLVRRERPSVPRVGHAPSTFSWPSGHCAATLVLYGTIALLIGVATRRWLWRALAWAIAVFLTLGVSVSRVYRGEHHLLDVTAGVLIGIAVLATAIVVLRRMDEVAA